ncbi:MAG TPA: hypothetical protein VFG06_10810 [Thermodesulfovibrionales bacterium]|nr:hypothetical protein [Thermodesulfovibrionales bacterium]
MGKYVSFVPVEFIERKILQIRGYKVCLILLIITGTNMHVNKETSSHRRGINTGLWGR